MFRRKFVRVCAIPLGVVYICLVPSLKEYIVRSAGSRFVWKMWYIVGWSPSGLLESFLSSRIFFSLLLCNRKIAFRWFKTCSVWSLGPDLFNTSSMHSYRWFSIIWWSLRRSAFWRWNSHIFLIQRQFHEIVKLEMYALCRCSCPYGVLSFSVCAFSVITALSIFLIPRPLRIIGRSIDIRRHTGR